MTESEQSTPRAGTCAVTEARVDGFAAIRLTNGLIAVDVIPELGGRVWSLRHRGQSREWIWQNRAQPLHVSDFGSNYDDNWVGGWEELFPNDAPGEFMGRQLPDHGEWWSRPWRWRIITNSPERVRLGLQFDGIVTETACEKYIEVRAGVSRVTVGYRIRNTGTRELRFLFKQHLPVSLTPAHELTLPGGVVTPVDLTFSTRLGTREAFEWPRGTSSTGNTVDLSIPPPLDEPHQEFVYVSGLPDGWCGVRDRLSGAKLVLRFPLARFPYTWLFMTFGLWRNLYTVVLEPCTNMPKDLETALRYGQCASLHAGDTFETEVYVDLS